MTESVTAFYDHLADSYHLIYGNWDNAVRRQADALHGIIQARLERPPAEVRLLDCSCGIGTQAIGLALLGYRVHATDISPKAIQRAEDEARRLGADLAFGVADMRFLESLVEGVFDVVITCDNALPHLISDADLLLAAQNMRAKLRPGGLLLASTRDYDAIVQERPRTRPVNVTNGPDGRSYSFQVWDWAEDGRSYELDHFIVHEAEDGWETAHGRCRYRAVLRNELSDAVRQAGFEQVTWHQPSDSGYMQQVLTALAG